MPVRERIRVLIVDDHPAIREGVAAMIANQSDMEVVAEASTAREAVESFQRHLPDVTLMDLKLPDNTGIHAIESIRKTFPQARVIILTTYRGDVQAMRALKAGAFGYLLKSMLRKELLETIRAVHAGEKRIPPEIASEIAIHSSEDSLTGRELQVLTHVAGGNSNKVVASLLSISETTVKAHMQSVLSKLSANDRTHAVMIAMRRGILDSGRE